MGQCSSPGLSRLVRTGTSWWVIVLIEGISLGISRQSGYCSVHCDSKDGRTTWGMQEPPHVISLMVCMGNSSGLGGTGRAGLLWIVMGSTTIWRRLHEGSPSSGIWRLLGVVGDQIRVGKYVQCFSNLGA